MPIVSENAREHVLWAHLASAEGGNRRYESVCYRSTRSLAMNGTLYGMHDNVRRVRTSISVAMNNLMALLLLNTRIFE